MSGNSEDWDGDNYCFACGPDNPIGLHMQVRYVPDGAETQITLSREFQGWKDVIHGGVVATLLDEIMAHAVLEHLGEAITTSLTVSYRTALKVGQTIDVIGRIKERKSRGAVAVAEIRTAGDGRILARAESKFILLSRLPFKNTS